MWWQVLHTWKAPCWGWYLVAGTPTWKAPCWGICLLAITPTWKAPCWGRCLVAGRILEQPGPGKGPGAGPRLLLPYFMKKIVVIWKSERANRIPNPRHFPWAISYFLIQGIPYLDFKEITRTTLMTTTLSMNKGIVNYAVKNRVYFYHSFERIT